MSSDNLAEKTEEFRTPVVWLVNEGGHDGYHKAERFGRIIALTSGNVNPFALDRHLVNIGQRLSMAKENDYIALSGLAILNALVVSIMLTKFDKVNMLQWSTQKGTYVKLRLTKQALERHAFRPIGPAE